jgi:Fe-S cluster assembly protein SufD
MSEKTDRKDWYLARFADFEQGLNGEASTAVHAARRQAIARFGELGFPSGRDEEWRYTSIAALLREDFDPLHDDAELPNNIDSLLVGGLDSYVLVFVDGRYAAGLSQTDGLPTGVRVESLAEGLKEGVLVEGIGAIAADGEDAFAALNAAFLRDGALVRIAAGVQLDKPVQLLFVASRAHAASNPRVFVSVEKNASAAIVESYASLTPEVHWTNSVAEISVGENAQVDHYRIQDENAAAYHISSLYVREERASNFRSTCITLGGLLTRNHVHTQLVGEGIDSTLNGLYVMEGAQHVDNHTLIEHVQPHCQSHEFYKGVLADDSKGVFRGQILVHQAAQKTDAYQANQNLLLSDRAEINTKPQLEIYADDVKCSHGATIGQLDEDAIFYLRSRGIGRAAARRVLTRAFAGEVIERVKIEVLRRELEDRVGQRLERVVSALE